MLDSTYMVASDPNTMRDTGATRNAEYFVKGDPGISIFYLSDKHANKHQDYVKLKTSLNTTTGFMKKRNLDKRNNNNVQKIINYDNRAIYSYGGKTSI